MTNHENRSNWIEGNFFDRGDGSIGYISYSRKYPGIARINVAYYAKGRGSDYTVYCAENDAGYGYVKQGADRWNTLAAARDALGL